MKPEQKSLRIGAAVILLAVLLRLVGGGIWNDLTNLLLKPKVSSFLLYAGTGRMFYMPGETKPGTPTQPVENTAPAETEPAETEGTEPVETEPTQPVRAVFSAQDGALVTLTNHPGYKLDMEALITAPLDWNLTGDAPKVLIIHSHASESYENTENYAGWWNYRTTDNRYNMVSVGNYLAQCLQEQGISVIHDTTVYDYPSYDNAYVLSRQAVENYLEQYPSIQVVLDIHRDAYEDKYGNQVRNTVNIGGITSSKLMLLVGSNASGQGHTQWQENLSMAVKLQTVLERMYPGLCRPLALRSTAFNQDVSPGALLVEVGTAGDTRQDALHAVKFLAEGIAALAYGSSAV